MPSMNVQFHMLFDELVDFVADIGERYSLSVELERWFPKAIHRVPVGADFAREVSTFGRVDCFRILFKPLQSKGYERFVLNAGNMKGNRLAQAQLGADTQNDEAFQMLKKIAAELKRRTAAGLWVVAPSGNVGFTKAARISPGAARASRSGRWW